ncbi:MAG: YtxH domain-containing protein [Bacteroidota bacterium]
MKNSGNIIGALLFGMAAGAVVGILLAPRKGSKTRNILISDAKNLTRQIKKKLEGEDLTEFYGNVHSASNPVKETV